MKKIKLFAVILSCLLLTIPGIVLANTSVNTFEYEEILNYENTYTDNFF